MTSVETITPPLAALDGHLPYDHPLSPPTAFKGLSPIIRRVVGYTPTSLWELETARLPAVLQVKRRQARRFAERELAPLALELDAMPHWPVGEPPQALLDLLAKASKAGWLSDMFPRPFGAASLGETFSPIPLRACIKTEEFARACGGQMLFLCTHMLGMAPLQLCFDLKNTRSTRQLLLPVLRELKQGKPHLFAFAITEPGNGSNAEEGHSAAQAKPGLVARRVDGGWRLNGRKCFISGGDLAKSLTTFAALEGEGIASWTCFLVRSDMPGFRPTRTELKMGMRASSAAELEFNEVFVPDSHVLGGLRNGWALSRQTLNMSRLPVAAMGVGFAQAATEIATDYACHTTLGGKALIHYQDVQLTLTQMMAETSAIRALVWQSAKTWAPCQATASMSKLHCTDVAMRVIERAMDLLGSQALLHTNRLEKVYRDCRVTRIFEGTNEINQLAIIEDLQGDLLGRMTKR